MDLFINRMLAPFYALIAVLCSGISASQSMLATAPNVDTTYVSLFIAVVSLTFAGLHYLPSWFARKADRTPKEVTSLTRWTMAGIVVAVIAVLFFTGCKANPEPVTTPVPEAIESRVEIDLSGAQRHGDPNTKLIAIIETALQKNNLWATVFSASHL